MSLQKLADRLAEKGRGITRAALSKYELGQSVPNALVLRDLALVFNVKTDFFFSEPCAAVSWLSFRKKASVSQSKQDTVQALAESQVERFLAVEAACGMVGASAELPQRLMAADPEAAENLAAVLRRSWDLGMNPLASLTELLESKGIILFPLEAPDDGFDGLVGNLSDGRWIAVYTEGKTVDRTRFTLAHELGHMLVGAEDAKVNEKLAHRFAGAFLAPAENLRRELGERRFSISLPELLLLKEKYGMSIQALAYRAKDLGILGEAAYRNLCVEFKRRGIGRDEPGTCPFAERPRLMERYLLRAVAEGRLSDTRAMELHPDYQKELRRMDLNRFPALKDYLSFDAEGRARFLSQAAEAGAAFYAADGALFADDAMDDVIE